MAACLALSKYSFTYSFEKLISKPGIACGLTSEVSAAGFTAVEDMVLEVIEDITLDIVDVGDSVELLKIEDILADTELVVGTDVADMKDN